MNTKTIPVRAVSDALMLAAINSIRVRNNPECNPARYAAFTAVPVRGASCRNKRQRSDAAPMHNAQMTHGDLKQVVSRVHIEHGPREVRQIWGAGLREMYAEIGCGVVR